MNLYSYYSVKIQSSECKKAFDDTVRIYRNAVDFFIHVRLREDTLFCDGKSRKSQMQLMERLTVSGKKRPEVPYDFSAVSYKFPVYYRRAAINEALGKVDSYRSNYANWEASGRRGKAPSIPKAGYVYPVLYHGNCFVRVDALTAKIKVFIRNTWDWVIVPLRKTDVDYIARHCSERKECCPTLKKRGKKWQLVFPFNEEAELHDLPVKERIILAVALGINNACACTAMTANGTILGRKTLSLSREEDCLRHAVNRLKKAQQHGAAHTPRLWAIIKNTNDGIAEKTARFIVDAAVSFGVSTIVFAHLDLSGKKRGAKKQRLSLWRARYVQNRVLNRAHQLHIRVARVSAFDTARLAYDGSGLVMRGSMAGLANSRLCKFQSGKIYNYSLNASYNIGARYFIRETLKSLPEKVRLVVEAKAPQCARRSTCTLSTLIRLNAELAA